MSEPVSQSIFFERIEQLQEYIDGGHGRVRASINKLEAEVKVLNVRCGAKLEDHATRLVAIETARAIEKEVERAAKGDRRNRAAVTASVVSIIVTVGLFALKAFLHL